MQDLLQVGAITNTHGVHGEVKVFPTTDDVNRFKKLKHVILAHLSEKNNYPELAYETVRAELLLKVGKDAMPNIQIAPRDIPSDIIEI